VIARLALALAALASGCGSTLTDEDRCDQGCAALLSCGVSSDQASCATTCLNAAPEFLSCIRGLSNPADCNGLAVCAWQQFSATHCGNTLGLTGACGSSTTSFACLEQCAGQPDACRCACLTTSGQAMPLLRAESCAASRCPVDCGAGGSPDACKTCEAPCSPHGDSCPE
jgi:hypothetical protein